MKILQVVHSLPSFNQAGTEIYTFELAKELSKKHEVYVFSRYSCLDEADYSLKKETLPGMVIYSINNTFRDCLSFEGFYQNRNIDEKFVQVLEEVKPDCVHIQHLVFLSVGIIEKAKERGIPVIFTLHDYWPLCPKWHLLKNDQAPCEKAAFGMFDPECGDCLRDMLSVNPRVIKWYYSMKGFLPDYVLRTLKKIFFCFNQRQAADAPGLLKKRSELVKKALGSVDFFIAPSQYLKDQFLKFGVHPEKISLSYLGINIPSGPVRDSLPGAKIRFAFIGTIIPAKGLHVLIKAFNAIASGVAELRIYGKIKNYAGFEGFTQTLKKITKNKNIKFMGEFKHDSAASVYGGLDVLVVPSIWQENNPLVIREAFLFKKPVIVSRIGGLTEVIKDNINGLSFNAGDPGDLKEKMERFINNSGLIKEFSANMAVKNIEDDAADFGRLYAKLSGEYNLS